MYWDGAYGTYAFQPTDGGSSNYNEIPASKGRVKDRSGQPRAGVPVIATLMNGTVWRTSTNAQGVFKFYGIPATFSLRVPDGYVISAAPNYGSHSGFMIQSTAGKNGNFEIVVPQDKGLVRRRDNDAPGLPWHQGDILQGNNNSVGIGSSTVKGATLLQSIEGNLEVVMWLHTNVRRVRAGRTSWR